MTEFHIFNGGVHKKQHNNTIHDIKLVSRLMIPINITNTYNFLSFLLQNRKYVVTLCHTKHIPVLILLYILDHMLSHIRRIHLR